MIKSNRFLNEVRSVGGYTVQWVGYEGVPYEVTSWKKTSTGRDQPVPAFFTRDWNEACNEFLRRVDKMQRMAMAEALGLKPEFNSTTQEKD